MTNNDIAIYLPKVAKGLQKLPKVIRLWFCYLKLQEIYYYGRYLVILALLRTSNYLFLDNARSRSKRIQSDKKFKKYTPKCL